MKPLLTLLASLVFLCSHARAGAFKPNEFFKDLKVRAVDTAEVGK